MKLFLTGIDWLLLVLAGKPLFTIFWSISWFRLSAARSIESLLPVKTNQCLRHTQGDMCTPNERMKTVELWRKYFKQLHLYQLCDCNRARIWFSHSLLLTLGFFPSSEATYSHPFCLDKFARLARGVLLRSGWAKKANRHTFMTHVENVDAFVSRACLM